jgi:Ca2+-binding RTX toxin-like protein
MADGKVDGTSGADTIISGYVDGDGDTAGTGPDLIYGYGGADSINGWLGVDTIYGGSGDDTIKGGNGIFDDLLYGGAGNDSFWGQAGNDTLYGGTGQDTLEGDTGDDVLYIASGDDDIYGGMNNDLLIVELGTSAWVDGESGDDTLDFAALTGTTVSSVNYYGGSTVDGYVMFANGERMEFRRVEALHNIGDGTVDGTAGNDSMVSGYTDGSYDAIGGSDGSHQDYIMGYAGNDTIAAGSGDDTVYGGAGTDSLFGGLGNDGLFGGSGDDILDGNEGSDTLHSGAGNDTYLGGTGQDYIDFGAETSGVLVDLNSGTLGGAAAGDVINSGIDGIFGTNFDDTISGFDPFSLSGDIYTNIFYGRGGNDLLAGCGGPDELYGGSGDDTFLMADAPGNDTIVGGETGADNDTIDFSALTSGINATYSSTEAGTVISGADTVSFSEVETLTLTDLADTVTGSAASA